MGTFEDTEELWILFRHFFPDLSRNHARIYRLLWQIDPMDGESIIKEASLARATVYCALNDLVKIWLVRKTTHPHVKYFAENPVVTYNDHFLRLSSRLKRGKQLITQIVNQSPSFEELYLVADENGKKRLISKNNRQTVLDEFALREIRRTAEEQIKKAEQSKLKPWMISNK